MPATSEPASERPQAREPTTVCQRAVAPLHIESSGAVVMRPATGDFWGCWGPPVDNAYQHIEMPAAARS